VIGVGSMKLQSAWFLLAIAFILMPFSARAQEQPSAAEAFRMANVAGVPTDWAHRRVVFSSSSADSRTLSSIQRDPRYWLQRLRRPGLKDAMSDHGGYWRSCCLSAGTTAKQHLKPTPSGSGDTGATVVETDTSRSLVGTVVAGIGDGSVNTIHLGDFNSAYLSLGAGASGAALYASGNSSGGGVDAPVLHAFPFVSSPRRNTKPPRH
jgi:hypothetical protein